MPPKKKATGKKSGGGKSKKVKKDLFVTEEEHCLQFGLKAKDIVNTPLGLTAQVLGVKYEDEQQTSGRLWVEYSNGLRAPLEPKQKNIIALGYKRSSEADHIWRDISEVTKFVNRTDDKYALSEISQRIRMEALSLDGRPQTASAGERSTAAAQKRPQTAG